MRPTWAAIDLDAFSRNISAITSRLPEGSRLVAVLKADGYGHGAVELSRKCDPARVAVIATALLEEALELRDAGIDLPLLVLGPLRGAQIGKALDANVTIGVVGPEELAMVCEVARDRDVSIHLKVDTGMGRMGFVESETQAIIEMIKATPRLKIEGLYTHFANAGDRSDPFTEEQIANFGRRAEQLREAGIAPPLHHLANSPATMRGIISPGDFVRVGVTLYGGEALDDGHSRLEPVMRFRTEIVRLKTLPPGHAVGYGMTYHTNRVSRIATLPVGYADGYDRRLSNIGEVLVRGKRAPVVGRVSMDLTTIDVTGHEVSVGDEVVLFGRQGDDEISAEEIAGKTGTISYDVFCSVSARVPRVYSNGVVRSRF
jgi:alanine racemase